jgi:hypothetical protein
LLKDADPGVAWGPISALIYVTTPGGVPGIDLYNLQDLQEPSGIFIITY